MSKYQKKQARATIGAPKATKEQETTHSNTTDTKKEQDSNGQTLNDIIKELEKIDSDDLKKEIVGQWIWVTGDTYQHRDKLKELGFKWASKKKAWYYTEKPARRYGKREYSMEEIKSKYGSQAI